MTATVNMTTTAGGGSDDLKRPQKHTEQPPPSSDEEEDMDELLSYGSPRKRPLVHPRTADDHQKSPSDRPSPPQSSDEHAADDLLAFYRRRCEQFQSERQVLVDHMTHVQVSKDELHRAKWALKMSQDELSDVETALQAANATIFELKAAKLALETENEALRIQEADDRIKIQHLLALTQPVVEEVTFFRDCRPSATARYPPEPTIRSYKYPSTLHIGSAPTTRDGPEHGGGSEDAGIGRIEMLSVPRSGRRVSRLGANATKAPRGSRQHQHQQHVLRTIYMPNEQAAVLTRTVENLRRQLAQQQELYEERLTHLTDDFADKLAKLRQEKEQAVGAQAGLEVQLDKVKRILHKTTKDYLVLRHQTQETERQAKEEIEAMKHQCDQLVEEKSALSHQALEDARALRARVHEESAQCAQDLREQAVARERDLHILREQYAAIQETYTRRVQDLELRLTRLRGRYRGLEKRRTMEMEGFTRDLGALKRQTQRLETVLYGRRVFIKHATEPPRRAHAHTRPSVLESQELHDEIAALQQRIADLAADVDTS